MVGGFWLKTKPVHLNNFAKDLTEAHGEGVSFLLQQVATGLRSFQSGLHDGLGPVTSNTDTHTLVTSVEQ